MSSVRIDVDPKFKVGDVVVHDVTGKQIVEARYWSGKEWCYDVGHTQTPECYLKAALTNKFEVGSTVKVKNTDIISSIHSTHTNDGLHWYYILSRDPKMLYAESILANNE